MNTDIKDYDTDYEPAQRSGVRLENIVSLRPTYGVIEMVDIVKQLCIKSYEITAQNGDYFKAQQGKEYTTTVPSEDKETVTVFSNYWVTVPKDHFVPVEVT